MSDQYRLEMVDRSTEQDACVGMRISSDILEHVCKRMIRVILCALPHATRGTIYSVGPIPDLQVVRIASGHRNGQTDEISWDLTSRSDYDFPGKKWEDYRDRPGGILEAMAWCVERQKSWTSDDPENNSRSVRKQLEGKAGEDYHHMEPVLVRKTERWNAVPPLSTYPSGSEGKPIWEDSPYATVAVIKIHFAPGALKRGDRSTRVIKELSWSLGTEMLSLHAKEMALEKEKALIEQRQETYDMLAHDFRNLITKAGFAYRAINNEINYLRISWEELIQQYLPERLCKQKILEQLNTHLENIKIKYNVPDIFNEIQLLSRYQNQLMESCLLPQKNDMWLRTKVRPLWSSILQKLDVNSELRRQVGEQLDNLQESFYAVYNKEVMKKIDKIPQELKDKWVDLAYREIDKDTNGLIKDYICFLDSLDMKIPRKRFSLKSFICLKSLVELIPELENKLNHHLDLLKKS